MVMPRGHVTDKVWAELQKEPVRVAGIMRPGKELYIDAYCSKGVGKQELKRVCGITVSDGSAGPPKKRPATALEDADVSVQRSVR